MSVVLIGTLDTKGEEYGWLRDRLIELGQEVLVVDAGIGPPGVSYPVDHPNDRVAAAASADLEELRARGDRGAAVTAMGEGAAAVLAELDRKSVVEGRREVER